MPFITLEYTANIDDNLDFQSFFSALHQTVSEIGNTAVANCMSRARKLEVFRAGEGGDQAAYVNLEIALLSGRTPAVLGALGQAALELLQELFSQQDVPCYVQLTEIDKSYLFK